MNGHGKGRWHPFGSTGSGKFYEELPMGPKIMVSHPARCWCPPTDVFECNNAFVIKVALSGLKRAANGELENVEVLVEKDLLLVRGVRTDDCEQKRCSVHQMEIYYGPFECRVRIATPFARDQVRAEYRDGFLEITIPKAPAQPTVQAVNIKPAE